MRFQKKTASVLAILYVIVLACPQPSIIITTYPSVFTNSFTKCLDTIKPKSFINDKDVTAGWDIKTS